MSKIFSHIYSNNTANLILKYIKHYCDSYKEKYRNRKIVLEFLIEKIKEEHLVLNELDTNTYNQIIINTKN